MHQLLEGKKELMPRHGLYELFSRKTNRQQEFQRRMNNKKLKKYEYNEKKRKRILLNSLVTFGKYLVKANVKE